MPLSTSYSRSDAIARYTEIADRLPAPLNPKEVDYAENLADLADEFDVFVLDGFGVLNVGDRAIVGAVDRVAQLQRLGKKVMVLTNGATMPVRKTVAKYEDWGFNFLAGDVISSRDALEHGLKQQNPTLLWGVAATPDSAIEELAERVVLLEDEPDVYANVDAFIFLSASNWSDHRQRCLLDALAKQSRPVLVGNPDLVAPREDAMSMEPGFFSHALADADVCKPIFFGKPFPLVFELVAKRISSVPPHRIAMVGDTLHTDILGGSSFGWRTVLVKNHGLMRDANNLDTIQTTGVRPHYIVATT